MKFLISASIYSIMLLGCKSSMKIKSPFNVMSLKRVIVYKTKADFSNNVPIMYSEELHSITSYPAPSDVQRFKELKPVRLSDEYLLDQMGVGESTVFLDYTLVEYSKLTEAPPLNLMVDRIIDYAPFIEFYDMGQPSEKNNTINKLNKLIETGEIKAFYKK